jgi:predicted exporter
VSLSVPSRWAVAAWLGFVLLCAVVITRTEFTTDFSAFLPRSPSPVQQVLVDQLREGVVSRLILIGVEGAPAPVLAQISKAIAETLRHDPNFAFMRNGEDIGTEKDRDYLWRNRYLLSPAVTTEHFSAAALRESLEEALSLLGSPAGIFLQRILPNDPTGELMRLLEPLESGAKPATREGVWFSPGGERALLLAQTRAAGYDIDAQEQAVSLIRSAYLTARPVNAPAAQVRLLLAGPSVFSVAARERIRGDAFRFSVIATALIAAMLGGLYRSWHLLGLGLLPIATGALAGVTAVSLGFGSVHGITLAFGTTLIGECVDYAVYLFTQTSAENPSQRTLDRIWPTLRLGVLTSICGFSAMLLSGFPGLAQLGLFSIAGLVAAASVTRWVLPALVPSNFSADAVTAVAPRVARVAEQAPAARYIAWLLVMVCGGYLAMHAGALWQDDIAALSPVSPREQRIDEQLRRDVGAPDARHMVIVSAPDEQSTLEAAENVAPRLQHAIDKGWLESFESPATYLPSLRTQRARQTALPPAEVLRERLSDASKGLPFKAGLFEPFVGDVATAKAQALLTRQDLQGTAAALKVDSLLVKRGQGMLVMLPLRGVRDPGAIAREVTSPAASQAMLIDFKRETDALYADYRGEAFRHALAGVVAIVVLLAIVLRSVRRVFLVMLPLAAAVIITSAFILGLGARLSIFHLVGLLLVIAVGSNYSLFFDRRVASLQDRERTQVSLVFANLSTVIGFGVLSFSSVPILREIGSTVAVGAMLSLVMSAIFIPAQPLPASEQPS